MIEQSGSYPPQNKREIPIYLQLHTEEEYFSTPTIPWQKIEGGWLVQEGYWALPQEAYASYEAAPLVVVIDDNLFAMYKTMVDVMKSGFRVRGYQPSQKWSWGETFLRKFVRENIAVATGAIVDKSLGVHLNGIELARLAAESIPTVMLTGEPNTRETHRVTQGYIERGYDFKNFRALLHQVFLAQSGN